MGLSNYQLVLLDNLIYLDTVVAYGSEQSSYTIKDIINTLLYAPGSNEAGTGTIITDCLNAHSGKTNSMMDIDEWKNVLLAIEADRDLCNLQIHSVEDAGENGFRAATFISHKTQENVIIFQGTSTANEWVDNGHSKGVFQADAPNSISLFPKRARLCLAACVAVHKAAKNAA